MRLPRGSYVDSRWLIGRTVAFDQDDCRLITILADFAVMGVRQQRQQAMLMQQASAAAAAEMANDLAHEINNPLQSLTNLLYLAAEGYHVETAKAIGRLAFDDSRGCRLW